MFFYSSVRIYIIKFKRVSASGCLIYVIALSNVFVSSSVLLGLLTADQFRYHVYAGDIFCHFAVRLGTYVAYKTCHTHIMIFGAQQ